MSPSAKVERLCLQVQEAQVKYESHSLLGTHSQPPPIREPSGKGLGGEEGQAGRLGKPRPLPSPGFGSSCTDKVFYPFPIFGDLPDLMGPLHFSPINTERHFTLNPGHLGLAASSHLDLRQLSPCPKPQHGDFKVHLDDTISAAAICQNTEAGLTSLPTRWKEPEVERSHESPGDLVKTGSDSAGLKQGPRVYS